MKKQKSREFHEDNQTAADIQKTGQTIFPHGCPEPQTDPRGFLPKRTKKGATLAFRAAPTTYPYRTDIMLPFS